MVTDGDEAHAVTKMPSFGKKAVCRQYRDDALEGCLRVANGPPLADGGSCRREREAGEQGLCALGGGGEGHHMNRL